MINGPFITATSFPKTVCLISLQLLLPGEVTHVTESECEKCGYFPVSRLCTGNDDVLKYSDRCHVFTDLNSKLTTDSERTKMVLLEKVARRVSRTLVRSHPFFHRAKSLRLDGRAE